MTIEFTPWPKIARLNRDIIITEKINGTNAAVAITPVEDSEYDSPAGVIRTVDVPAGRFHVGAQSRTRLITPQQDNFGFAAWVREHAITLADTLGAGTHFGEWWGSGIQNGGGLPKGERRFSLFNTTRWDDPLSYWKDDSVPGLRVVPTLYRGPFDQPRIEGVLNELSLNGSYASPGFMDPEGIVIFHTASNEMYKVTLKGDEAPKGPEAHANDEQK